MSTLDVTWVRAARVWWSIAWRSLLASVAGGFLIGLLAGIFKALTGAPLLPDQQFNWILMLISIPAGIWAVHEVLGKEYRGYRVALVLSQEAELEQRLTRTSPD